MLRRNREIVIFNLSAIDLFCSGMGAVMVLMVLLMPYYRKQAPVTPPKPAPEVVVTPPPAPVPPKPEPVKPVPEPGVLIRDLELMIVIDTTSSMGDQIEDLRRTLSSTVKVLSRLSENLKVGVVAYRDRGDSYVVRGYPLTRVTTTAPSMKPLQEFIGHLEAAGGGDPEEAVAEAMAAATGGDARWTKLKDLPGRSRQVILVVADAPGHDRGAADASKIAEAWHGGDARRKVSCATNPVAAPYFKVLASAGGGSLVPLSDILSAILEVVIDRP